jgi:hypothetical protein
MTTITTIVKNGRVEVVAPADWPEGTPVLIEPLPHEATVGIREEDWPTDPEGIARHLARMDQAEPLEMTPQEEAEWQAARMAQKELELARWEERCQKLEGLFE